jgi:molybdopterin-binding protein
MGRRIAASARLSSGRRSPSHVIKWLQLAWHCPSVAFINMETVMRISARNQLKGTVVEVKKGATTSHVRVDIGGGKIVTSSITNEAVDELGIKAKDAVTVVIKASDVMIGVD